MMISTIAQRGAQVRSADGTTIGYRRSGRGPALVLVHGTAADHTRWAPILPPLETRFTVYAVDRRGRGLSGDAPTYAFEREVEDIAAVVESIDAPVALFGHSYGAMVALEAAPRTKRLSALALYEPAIPTGVPFYAADLIERLEAMLAAGDREGVLRAMFTEVVRMSEAEADRLRTLPGWAGRVAAAHTIPRELLNVNAYNFDPARFRVLRVPTTFLLGGDSPSVFRDGTERASAAVPGARLAVMPGQQHAAMNTAPELFIETLLRSLGQG